MTTIIYKKDKYLAADKKTVGGVAGIGTCDKLFHIIGSAYDLKIPNSNGLGLSEVHDELVFGIAGRLPFAPYVRNKAYELLVENKFDPLKLMDFQAALKSYDDDFSGIMVARTYGPHGFVSERAYEIASDRVEEVDTEICTAGSGWNMAYTFMDSTKNHEPKDVFAYVSTRDNGTSAEHSVIPT